MIDTSDIVKLLSTMVNRVEQFDSNTALRLRLLTDAIRGEVPQEIEVWATSDLYAMIHPDNIVERFRSQQVSSQYAGGRIFELLRVSRNAFLFLPFVVTCFSLALAADSYANLLNARPNRVSEPFLYLWQQGFNGSLPSWLTFSSIAWLDVVLLVLIFLLTLFMYSQSQIRTFQQGRVALQREQDAQVLRSDLVHVLAVASLYLSKYKRPLTAGDNLELVARRIDTTARRMEEKFESIIGQFDGMTQNVTKRLEGMTQNVTQRFDGMTQNVTKNFDGMTQNLTDKFDGMTQNVTKNFDGMAQNVTSRFDGMTQNVTKNLDGMTQSLEKNFDGMTQNIADRFDGMTQNVTHGFDGMIKDVFDKYDGMSQQVIRRFGILTNQMMEQLLDGSKYLKEVGNLTSGVIQTSQQIRLTADTLKETNAELVLGMKNLVAPATDLSQQQEVLINTAANSLRLLEDAANSMVDLGKKQDRWGTDLRNILDTLDLTIDKAADLAMRVGDFTSRQDTFLSQMQQEQQAQTALATLISDATEKVKEALREAITSAHSLNSMATDMNDMMRLQASNTANHQTIETIQRYANAAQAIERSSSSLDSSAGTLQKAGQQLTGVIQELEKRFTAIK